MVAFALCAHEDEDEVGCDSTNDYELDEDVDEEKLWDAGVAWQVELGVAEEEEGQDMEDKVDEERAKDDGREDNVVRMLVQELRMTTMKMTSLLK